MTPQTTAQRQAKYRAKRPFAGKDENGERRINTWVHTGTYLALERLARHHGITRREMLERLVVAEETRITATLVDEDLLDAYYDKATLRSNSESLRS
ncbi:MAG: hypothetical protein ACYCQH_09860 [Acidithiobacillus ferrooxidans]|jgi:hypothetical protein|uniref:Uncharacterized protein n=1 Tax=mine drainage metagenome TaxID=410659 RepID=E6Q8P9_9ZZZZ